MPNENDQGTEARTTVITALYLLAVAIGFGADTPALSPPALFMVALTLIVGSHLVNVHRYASLEGRYHGGLIIADGFLILLFAWMFNLLAHPLAGGLGSEFVPPGVVSADYLRYTAGLVPAIGEVEPLVETRELIRNAFFHFFVLAAAGAVILAGWHVVAHGVKKKDSVNFVWWPYVVGWVVILVVALFGAFTTGGEELSSGAWNRMYRTVNWLAGISVLLSAVFLFLVMIKHAFWKKG